MLLKSSDFISHDIEPETVFEGCVPETANAPPYELELVLRKWYHLDPAREFRCFVRSRRLLGMFSLCRHKLCVLMLLSVPGSDNATRYKLLCIYE